MTATGTARDYMTPDPITFAPDLDIHRAIRTLLDRNISGAPVVDQHGRLVGMLTKRDCLRIAFSASYHQEPGGRVADFMSAPVETVDAGTAIVEVAECLVSGGFQRYPVTQDDRLVGIISRQDVLRALAELW